MDLKHTVADQIWSPTLPTMYALYTYIWHYIFFSALSISSSLDKLKTEILDLKHTVADSIIQPAKQSIDDLQVRFHY